MHIKRLSHIVLLATTALAASTPVVAQTNDGASVARAQMVARQPSRADQAIGQWKYLTDNRELSFADYAGFALAYPDFPRMEILRQRAESALDSEPVSTESLVAFFDRLPPLTNAGKARYALALAALQRPQAAEIAREAWRGGAISGSSEAYMAGLFGSRFTADDQDARMNALLWQGEKEAAARQVNNVSSAARPLFMARLALIQGEEPSALGISLPANAMSDPGYVYNLASYYRAKRENYRAIQLMSSRPAFTSLPVDAQDFVTQKLAIAKSASPRQAAQIAASVDDLFPAGFDVSKGTYKLRDDYTSLMWLGGTKALWEMGDGVTAAPLFYRYGAAARTPPTRSKGFYWAGNAAARAGQQSEAMRYFTMAAEYPDMFYGQLALERLGQSTPAFTNVVVAAPTPAQRSAFAQDPLTQAMRAISRNRYDWRTERYFFSALADKADSPEQMQLVAELAQELGMNELAVVAGMTAPEHGLKGFERVGYPVVATPGGSNWTMVHAIARQESEFDRNRVSHAGARGLMQLMPGTAREQAGKLGMNYMSANLTADPTYNIRLGDGYFARMLEYYGGAYPLAIAAYNAGPGNVNKWLRANGDPRKGGIDWLRWIEEIPIYETKNYVQRVIGNATTYQAMYPDRVNYTMPRGTSALLGKRSPG